MGNLPVARPLPTEGNTNTEKTQTHINTSSGIRTHNPNVLTGEGILYLSPLDHCDWLIQFSYLISKCT
jgi:hypothetical protein